jgi:hypothetical protein
MIYVLIAAFSFWFAEILQAATHVSEWLCEKEYVYKDYYGQKLPRRLKPFDCTLCLSFWIALAYGLATDPTASLLNAGTCSLLAVLLALFTNKYLR